MESPLQAFVDDMDGLGLCPQVEAGLVVCDVVPVTGARAGGSLLLGVAVEEVNNWPTAPPHWIHLPAEIQFRATNSEASSKPSWLRHSRNCAGWGDAPAAVCWHAHLQAVLGEVVG